MGSRRQDGGGEMTKFQFLQSLFLLSCVQARLVRRETSSPIEAAQQGNLDRVRRLVNDAHAPDVNELGPNDRTPLIFAASFGDPPSCRSWCRLVLSTSRTTSGGAHCTG